MATSFTNERKAIHCENAVGAVTLTGEFQFQENNNRIYTMNGSVTDGDNRGTFVYLEEADGVVTYNIQANRDFYNTVKSIADATIEDIHTEFDK